MIGVLFLLAQVLIGFAIALFVPAAIGLAAGEPRNAAVFLVLAGMVGFLSGAVFFALRGRVRRLDRVNGFVLILAIWTIPSLIAALPLMRIGNVDFMTGLFEAVSGYTTTGATVLPTLEPLGLSGVFFRAELQWLGGLMTLITIVTVIAPSGLGGISSPHVALVTSTDGRATRLSGTLRQVVGAYLVVTFACAILLLASDLPPFDALCLALSTVSTGGFMPIDGDFSDYGSTFADVVVMVFMLIGATSIVWHRMVIEGRWALAAGHRESYWVIGVAMGVGALYAVMFTARSSHIGGMELLEALRDGLFTGASLVSTTGFVPAEGALSLLPAPAVLLLALIGGGAISTAGGLKYYRIGGMFTLSFQELRRLVYPHGVRRARFGGASFNFEVMKSIWSGLVVSILVVFAATLLIATSEPAFDGALTAAIASFSSIGPLYAGGWPGEESWPSFAEFGVTAKLVMIFTMIIGRFEVLVLIGALNLAYWRS
ncbi:MAG: TrkH family potassium uptake protein [Hyphomicrobiales bacterium]|nr:TrkH family potassium uptake protein [Hyphomicrobiales bacterium]